MTFFATSMKYVKGAALHKSTMAESKKQEFAHVYENGRDFSKSLNDPSARSPNRFFIEIRLSRKWTAVSKDIVDVGGSNFVGRSVATNH